MSVQTTKADLSIYMTKDGVRVPSQIVKGATTLTSFPIRVGTQEIGTLFIKDAHLNPPRWAKFFKDVVPEAEFGRNSSTAAVLLVPADKRVFVLTFGQGRHLIDSEFIEMNFGLRVALNCLDANSLRSIDKSSFETYPKQSREQSGRAAELQYFGVDVERDLLRGITGVPKDKSLGERLSGMDSVKLSLEVDLSSLKGLLSKLVAAFEADNYKKGVFSWVDHIGEVKDPTLVQTLDQELLTKIHTGDTTNVWLSVPEIIDWNRVVGFRYAMTRNAPSFYDIRLADFIQLLNGKELNKERLLKRKIYCVDADYYSVFDRPTYYFLYAEVPFNSEIYLLNNGKWYRINKHYARQVNDFFVHVRRYDRTLPDYEDKTEGDYNKRVAQRDPKEFALLDKKNVYPPGAASPVEPCDLLRSPNEFIHVKRYGGSSVLSHLFNQGLVSGELFQMQADFRKLLNGKLPQQHKLLNVAARPTAGSYKVVFAIISESVKPLSIPFFSKISLKHTLNRLEAIGFGVMLAKVSVSDVTKKTAKYPGSKKTKQSFQTT
ncbi:MAG: TIGR04141 family sporadically distributed protein [Candidatus Binatia bacterium]